MNSDIILSFLEGSNTIFFFFLDFSLTSWKTSAGIDPSQSLSTVEIRKLQEALGIAPFLMDAACERYSSPYVPPINGWRTGNTASAFSLWCIYSNLIVNYATFPYSST